MPQTVNNNQTSFHDCMNMADNSPSRRPRSQRVELTEEDMVYMRKIEKLANERFTFYREKELREKQVQETNKPNPSLRTPAKMSSKRKRSLSPPTSSSGDQKKKRKPPTKVVRTALVVNEATERLKGFIENELKGTDVKVVIQKNVFASDTDQRLCRVTMPFNQLENDDFLTADERRVINIKENHMEVELLGPRLVMHKSLMRFKKWHMNGNMMYVFITNWYEFWKENQEELPVGSKIQVWSFRRDQELCFAVVCVEKPDGVQKKKNVD